ncbi:MAG TPA: methyltransferase domain-containing protein [Acetivibrio sp.]|jgi:ubiquinone/menaquinone biosynthesis C-methylase UbiE|nr:class I SAM-dependent methyltransferase [Clostridium sp.]HPT90130.1 methyltransferase domain-containing protein [Acetivibrio sp.]HQA57644.1 methyltransferase domain-containing protein [Acetivibrio sp.]
MPVNYNEISEKYDNVRSENKSVIDSFIKELKITNSTRILDFGCGTGNYANTLQRLTQAQVYGVEPSGGMRAKAIAKNPSITFVKGNHESIPFEDNYFDFVYMTDVIHHIPDVRRMFAEIGRVTKSGGSLCIVTQSHNQIDNRFYVKYFPSTAIVDKERYPDIDSIISKAHDQSFEHIKNVIIGNGAEIAVTSDFVEFVRNKGFSMFHLIPDAEYTTGLKQLETDVLSGNLKYKHSGETLVWFKKK